MPSRSNDRRTLTVGQIARICDVSTRAVAGWFDKGLIKGYRLPGSNDRRVPREEVIRFLREHGMPLGDLEPS